MLRPEELNAEERAIWDETYRHRLGRGHGPEVSAKEASAVILARRALFSPAQPEPKREETVCPNCREKVPSEGHHLYYTNRTLLYSCPAPSPAPVAGELDWQVRHAIAKMHEQKLADLDAVAEDLKVWARSQAEEIAALRADLARISDEMGLPPTYGPAPGDLRRQLRDGAEARKELDELKARSQATAQPVAVGMSEELERVLGFAERKANGTEAVLILDEVLADIRSVRAQAVSAQPKAVGVPVEAIRAIGESHFAANDLLATYLPPDSGISDRDVVNGMLGIFDNKKQIDAKAEFDRWLAAVEGGK